MQQPESGVNLDKVSRGSEWKFSLSAHILGFISHISLLHMISSYSTCIIADMPLSQRSRTGKGDVEYFKAGTRTGSKCRRRTSFLVGPGNKLNFGVQAVERMFQSGHGRYPHSSMPAISTPCRLRSATLQPHVGRRSKYVEAPPPVSTFKGAHPHHSENRKHMSRH